jgi:hypothetical protein
MFQRSRSAAWVFLCVTSLVLLLSLPSAGQFVLPQDNPQQANVQHVVGPLIFSDVHHDVSPAVRDMPTIDLGNTGATAHVKYEAEPVRRIPLPPGMGTAQQAATGDAAVQSAVFAPAAALAPTVNLGFDGLGNASLGFTVNSAPPDTNGAVGLNQYVQWVNTSFAVFDKATGAKIAGPTAGNTLWAGFGGGCQTNNDGDPIVLYDKAANRWVFAQFSVSTTPFLQCVAVSTTSDATGTYNRYSFQYSTFDDYPKMGVWPDAYYTTFNMFNGNTFVGADACAYDRTAMLNGQPATQVCFQQGNTIGGLLPSDLDGSTAPPAGSPNFLVFFGSNNLNLFKFHVNFATPSASTFTGPTVLSVTAFSPLCNGGTCVVQPGTTTRLDSLADRLMYRLAYRNFGNHESLVVNHSVTAGTGGGVRWYEIQNPNGTPVVAQQSTFAPDSAFRWMGSIAMDQSGDMAMGYSVSSSTINPSIRFTGRTPSDPVNTMEAETSIIAGTGSQTGNLTRWGDYSAITVDPVDDCTFWYTTEYMKTTGSFNWNTRIANFKFPNCGGAATPDYTLSASPTSVTVTQGGSGGTSTITVNPTGGFTGSVTLSASGLPAGVTASFGTNPTTSTSVLTLTASSTATTGTATVTITGTSGALTHTTTVSLTVNAPAQPNFSLSASPASLSVVQGNSGSSTITVSPINGFTGSVTLSASGLPAGVTASFGTNPTTSTSVVTFTASTTATTGTATVTITGTSGTLTHTTTISLTVNSAAAQNLIVNGGFENGSAPWTLTAGVLNSSASEPPHSGTFDAWLDGYGVTHTDSATQTVTIPSTATTATLTFWLHIDTAETTTTVAFDTLQVQVLNSANTVLATLGTFSNLNKAAGYQQRSFSVINFKGQTVKIRFLGREDSSLQTSFVIDDVALNVQ